MSDYGDSPSNDPYRHPGGRSCRNTAAIVIAAPVLLIALAAKVLRRKR